MMGSTPASERSQARQYSARLSWAVWANPAATFWASVAQARRRRQECELDPLRGGSRAVVSGLDDRPDCWVQRYQNRLRNSGTVRYSSDTTRTTEIDKLARPGMGGRLRLGRPAGGLGQTGRPDSDHREGPSR